MSELRIQSLRMPAADLGPDNPLPPLFPRNPPFKLEHDSGYPEDMLGNMSIGHLALVLPYTLQDQYSRELEPKEFQVAVLENEILRATFLLEYGGRLWSLFHKPHGIELLKSNPVFQLANLGIRNAWFSGGIEWNIGTIGHSPFTCSPVFAAHVKGGDGTPILRLYEWERFRKVPYQIDAYLPDGSPVLFVRVRISNPNDEDVPMYWWTNIAVPETPSTRVIVPAKSAYCLGCGSGGLDRISVPVHMDTDITYPSQVSNATDFFFQISKKETPWIAALNAEGHGLVHLSTHHLFGRKAWTWGDGPGGKNWQRFLSPPGDGYTEIQAGLTRTQLEHLPMPSGADWSWLEAFGLMEADPSIVHGQHWSKANKHVTNEMAKLISFGDLEEELHQGRMFLDAPPVEILQQGSGWGALEQMRRTYTDEPPLCSEGLSFSKSSLTDQQYPWIELLENGHLPEGDHQSPRTGFIVGDRWRNRLELAVQDQDSENWSAWYHLGIMYYHEGNLEGASGAWNRSLETRWTPWAARNLGVLAWVEGQLDYAANLFSQAHHAAPSLYPLIIEYGTCLIAAQRGREWLDLLDTLDSSLSQMGRVRFLEAQAALSMGDLQSVGTFFDENTTVADIREGDHSLSDLWFAYQEKRLEVEKPGDDYTTIRQRVRASYPIPPGFDFRLFPDKELS
ncbi:MAG: DUF5107 domain-containing protein [Anaerolineales bacterium]